MRNTGQGAVWWRRGTQRVARAVLASLLLHGAVLTAWHLQGPRDGSVLPASRQAMEVLWIATLPAFTAPPVPQPVARGPASLRAPPQAQVAVKIPVSFLRPSRTPELEIPSAPTVEAALPVAPGPRADATAAAAPPPQRTASDIVVPDGPIRWSAEAVGRADRQERAWRQRHGSFAAAQLAAGAGHEGLSSPGGVVAPREWRGSDGARVVQGQGPGGSTYCVRLPSANRLPELGAAPRVAPVTHCP